MNICLLFKQFLSVGPVSFSVFMVSLVVQRNVHLVICYQINQFICSPSVNLLLMVFGIEAFPIRVCPIQNLKNYFYTYL